MVTCCTLGYRASRGRRGECGCRTRSRTLTRSSGDWHRPTPEQESQIKTVAAGKSCPIKEFLARLKKYNTVHGQRQQNAWKRLGQISVTQPSPI